MVFFTCNACGSSLKKNQVEKHYQNECRSCSVLSCMDCGQDFYGDDYVGHTQCISEAQKYQGSLFKGTGNKGDTKQREWLEKARMAMRSAKVNPKLKSLLEKVSEYPNIPRKKSKFENFVRNSCNVRDGRMLGELWDIFNQDAQLVTCATNMSIIYSKDGEKLEKEVVSQETGCDVVNSERLMKKNKIKIPKQCETEMKEEVDCHGPVKKITEMRYVEEKVNCDGPVKKKKKHTGVAMEEEVDYDGPVKKKKKQIMRTEEVDCDGPVKKKKKHTGKTMEEKVDCDGPIKKKKKHTGMTMEEEVDCDGPVNKKKKHTGMTMEEEVDCDGPVNKKKKKIMRTVKEEVSCEGTVKKKKMQTEMRTMEEEVYYDGLKKKKIEMRKVEEQENVSNDWMKRRRKREATAVSESVLDEKELVDQEKVWGLESVDEGHEVVVIGKTRKQRNVAS